MYRSLLCIGILCALFILPSAALAGPPTDTAKEGVDRVVAVAADKSLELSAKREKIRSIVGEFFDFNVLSRLTLGRHWKQFSPEQQEKFVQRYQKLLENVYMDRILAYSGEKVLFEKETMHSDNKAEVESNISTGAQQIPIDYRMVKNNGNWKVYDVVIEGVSMVSNYRSQFNEILAKQSPDELLKTLEERVKGS